MKRGDRKGGGWFFAVVLITLVLAIAFYISYDLLAPRFWLGASLDTAQEEFMCSADTKVLSEIEQKKRAKRAKNLSRSLDNAIGFYASWGGHDWFSMSRNKLRPEKLYQLQKLLTVSDWEILSEMYINKHKYSHIIQPLFAVNGEQSIAILECKIENSDLAGEEKGRFIDDLTRIKTLSVEPRFVGEYEYHNNYIEAFLIIGFFLLILVHIVVPIIVLFIIIKYCITRSARRQN